MLSFQIPRSSFEFVRLSRLYAPFRGDDATLAQYPTLDALLRVLDGPEGAPASTRSSLLAAVIALHRASPGPLGAAVVMHAFHGMLGRLANSLVGVDRDDAEALVACGFVEAVRRVRPAHDPARIAMYVRQETRRCVFAMLRREEPDRSEDEGEEAEVEEPGPLPPANEGRPAGLDTDWAEEDVLPGAATIQPRSRWRPDVDAFPDPASLAPIEERLDGPTATRVSDEEVLRAHAVRGGLRRLATCLLADAGADAREHLYRQLLHRAKRLVGRRK
ncbi:MAG TPA: hypothetical protein VIY73_07280 [Polyangiaceae bacterium]